jgi:hypothetical protein
VDRGPAGREAQMPCFRLFPITDKSDRARVGARRRAIVRRCTSTELGIFRGTALKATAGTAIVNVPVLKLDQLYVLELRPQSDVQFVQPPERAARAPMPTAGLTRFIVTRSGKYRVTVDSPLWIDAITPSAVMAPSAFNGWHQCSAFRKSVEYALQAGLSVVLQLSDAAVASVKIAVEPSQ